MARAAQKLNIKTPEFRNTEEAKIYIDSLLKILDQQHRLLRDDIQECEKRLTAGGH